VRLNYITGDLLIMVTINYVHLNYTDWWSIDYGYYQWCAFKL
jgi:hypothetical protein